MKTPTRIVIGADHAGFDLKEALKAYLNELGYSIVDKGAFEKNNDDDYPDFIMPVAREVASDPEHSRGIVIGGSGQGEAIDANRVKGIRAAVYYGDPEKSADLGASIIKLSREHNDSNILSLGARFLSVDEAKEAVLLWLNTAFSGDERHVRRIAKLDI